MVEGLDRYFVMNRLPLARALQREGAEITVIAAEDRHGDAIRDCGFDFVPSPLERGHSAPHLEAMAWFRLVRLYKRLDPDLVHHANLKPIVYGSLAARWTPTAKIVNTVTGVGYLFTSTARARLSRTMTEFLLRVALNGEAVRTIFQNPADRDFFISSGLVDEGCTELILGSGVDMERFAPKPEPQGTPIVLFASRLLRDKGLLEFMQAAQGLIGSGCMARFVVVGMPDPGNPTSLTDVEVRDIAAHSGVEFWGEREDMAPVVSAATVVVLPSYREGLPKLLLEASAVGRGMIATDVPGCRDVVQHEQTGLLVPAREPGALADAIGRLLGNSAARARMIAAARERAEREFAVDRIVEKTLAAYDKMLPGWRDASGAFKSTMRDAQGV